MISFELPKVNLAFNVGVTGHRNLSEEEKKALSSNIYNILNFIKEKILEAYKKSEIYLGKEPLLRIVSSLAEGSDRLIAHIALNEDLNYKLQCPLPMCREEYLMDFATESSKAEFSELLAKADSIFEIDEKENKTTHYLDAGLVMLEHIDVLVAVWDGLAARGIGGTADILRYAERNNIPVIWINRGNYITNFKYLSKSYTNQWQQSLMNYIEETVVFPKKEVEIMIGKKTRINNIKGITKLYEKFISFLSWSRKHESINNEYISISDLVRKSYDYDVKKNVETYLDIYEKADRLALYYAKVYRTASLIRAILPFLATLALAIGFYWNWSNPSNIVNVIGFFLQALLLFFILNLSTKNEKEKWHQKFIDYRILAELFRQVVYVSPLGYVSKGIKILGHENSWYKWYYRCTVREVSLPNTKIDSKKLSKYFSFIKKQLVNEQISYHTNRASIFNIISKRLNKTGYLFFGLGIIVTVIRVFAYFLTYIKIIPEILMGIKVTTFSNMLSLLMPAIGSVAFSVLSQCGFENLEQKHRFMKNQLELMDKEESTINYSFNEISAHIFRIIDVAISEVAEWRTFVKSKTIKKV